MIYVQQPCIYDIGLLIHKTFLNIFLQKFSKYSDLNYMSIFLEILKIPYFIE